MSNVQPLRHGAKPGPKVRAGETRPAATIRLLQAHRQRVSDITEQLGVPFSDYIAYIVARAHGWEIPTYLQHIDKLVRDGNYDLQGELPLALEA